MPLIFVLVFDFDTKKRKRLNFVHFIIIFLIYLTHYLSHL